MIVNKQLMCLIFIVYFDLYRYNSGLCDIFVCITCSYLVFIILYVFTIYMQVLNLLGRYII